MGLAQFKIVSKFNVEFNSIRSVQFSLEVGWLQKTHWHSEKWSNAFVWHTKVQRWPQCNWTSHIFWHPPYFISSKLAGSNIWKRIQSQLKWFAHNILALQIFLWLTLWTVWWVLQTRSNSCPMACWFCSSFWMFFQMDEAVPKQLILPIMKRPCLARDNATQIRFLNAKYPILFVVLLRTNDNNIILLSSPWKLSTAVIRTFRRFGYFLRS